MAGSGKAIPAPTGRHGLPADVVAVYQRERLLMAMIELAAKRGYPGTTVDHLVKEARVGYVAFYEIFTDKEECFLAAFERIVSDARTEMEEAVSGRMAWPEQIAATLSVIIELIAAEPIRGRVALVEAQAAGEAALARYEEVLEGLAPKLREGRAFNPNAAALSDALEESILGQIAWILHLRLVKGEADQIRGLLGEAIQIALAPYIGEAEALRLAKGAVARAAPR